jgi:hypothetical protein
MTGPSKWLEQHGAFGRALLEAHETERAPDEVRLNSLQSARVALLGSGILAVPQSNAAQAAASAPDASSLVETSVQPAAQLSTVEATGSGAGCSGASVQGTSAAQGTTLFQATSGAQGTSLAPGLGAGAVGAGKLGVLAGVGLGSSLKLGTIGLLLAGGVALGTMGFERTQQSEVTPPSSQMTSTQAIETQVVETLVVDAQPTRAKSSGEQSIGVGEPAVSERSKAADPEPRERANAKEREQLPLRPLGELPSSQSARPRPETALSVEPDVAAQAPKYASNPAGSQSESDAAKNGAGENRAHNSAEKESGLTDELELIQRARSLLKAGEPQAALRVLDRYASRHPTGALAPEAHMLRQRAERAR